MHRLVLAARRAALALSAFLALLAPAEAADELVFSDSRILAGSTTWAYYASDFDSVAIGADGVRYSFEAVDPSFDGSQGTRYQQFRIVRTTETGRSSILDHPICLPEPINEAGQADIFAGSIAATRDGVIFVYGTQCQSRSAAFWHGDIGYTYWNPRTGDIKRGSIRSLRNMRSPVFAISSWNDRLHVVSALATTQSNGVVTYDVLDLSTFEPVTHVKLPFKQPITGNSDFRIAHLPDGSTQIFSPTNTGVKMSVVDAAGVLTRTRNLRRPKLKTPAGRVGFSLDDVTSFAKDTPLAIFQVSSYDATQGQCRVIKAAQKLGKDGNNIGNAKTLIDSSSACGSFVLIDPTYQFQSAAKMKIASLKSSSYVFTVDEIIDAAKNRIRYAFFELDRSGEIATRQLFTSSVRTLGWKGASLLAAPYAFPPRNGVISAALPVMDPSENIAAGEVELELKKP